MKYVFFEFQEMSHIATPPGTDPAQHTSVFSAAGYSVPTPGTAMFIKFTRFKIHFERVLLALPFVNHIA